MKARLNYHLSTDQLNHLEIDEADRLRIMIISLRERIESCVCRLNPQIQAVVALPPNTCDVDLTMTEKDWRVILFAVNYLWEGFNERFDYCIRKVPIKEHSS